MESYLHEHAKKLLYEEIERKGCFDWKTETECGYETLIERHDYRHECLLMEFPTGNSREDCGLYPDEIGVCKFKGNEFDVSCHAQGYRFNNGNGVCECSHCNHLDYSKVIIHDIAAFWKGYIAFAIEIVNKHPPEWIHKVFPTYPVYIVSAENILKRVSDTPVFVDDVIKQRSLFDCDW